MIDVPPAASGTDAGTAPASGNGALHAGTGTGGAYVPIGRAAALLGLSGDVLRKRAAAGSVRARKVDSRWWIWVDGAAPSADVDDLAAAPPPEAAGPAPEPNPPVPEAAGTPPEAAPAPPGREEWRQLLGLVEKLQEENRNLAGQLGFLQAQRQALEERIKLLEAPPPEPEPEPEPEAADAPEPEPPEPAASPRSWWHRTLTWLRG